MIGFQRPLLLSLLLLVLPLLWWLHRSRRRPHSLTVSSLLLWRRALGDSISAPRRARPTVRLVLEMLAAFWLLLAAAGPFRDRPGAEHASWTVLIDRRPGMGGAYRDGGRSRLEEGVERLLAWAKGLPTGTRLRLTTVPALTEGPREFRVEDVALAAWLKALRPAARSADLEASVAALAGLPGRHLVVTHTRPPVPAPTDPDRLGVGAPGDNSGFVWARLDATPDGAAVLFAGVLNGGSRPAVRSVIVEAGRDRATLAEIRLEPGRLWVADGERLPPWVSGRPFTVRLSDRDDLAADDVIRVRPRPDREISIVSSVPVPARVLQAVTALGAEPVQTELGAIQPGRPALYWGVFPGEAVAGAAPLVLVAGEGTWNGLRLGPEYRPQALLRGPGWSEVGGIAPYPEQVARARAVEAGAEWTADLLGVDRDGIRRPIVLRRDAVHVLAFDPLRDAPGWAERDAFPAFFYRALGQAGQAFEVEGLLSAADTALGTFSSPLGPAGANGIAAAPGTEREPLGAWIVLLGLVTLLGIYRFGV